MGCNLCRQSDEYTVEQEFLNPNSQNEQENSKDKHDKQKPNISYNNVKIGDIILKDTNNNINENVNVKKNEKEKGEEKEKENLNEKNNEIEIKKENESKREENNLNRKNENLTSNKITNNSSIKQNKEFKEESIILSSNKNDYNSRVVDLINEIRTNPQKYSDIIFNNIQYISKEIKVIANDETGQNEEKQEIYFQKKVKVKLYIGEKAFIEASDFLKNLSPMKELIVKDEIKLNMPDNIEEMKDNIFVKKQLVEMKTKNNINAFFKDSIKNPEVGVLMMIVGDYKNSETKKRNVILNPDYKYIAVNSKFFGDLFFAYYTFSK